MPAPYLGDYQVGGTLDFKFATRNEFQVPITLAGSPAVAVYKANGTTETTTGVTLTVDFDSRTGLHHVRVALSDSFYASGNEYQVVLTAGTVDGVAITPAVLATFSIDRTAVYHAAVSRITDGSNDEYAVCWFKSGILQIAGITSPTIQLIKYADGGDLITATAMSQIGSTGAYKLTTTTKMTAGETYLVRVTATIDGATRTWQDLIAVPGA